MIKAAPKKPRHEQIAWAVLWRDTGTRGGQFIGSMGKTIPGIVLFGTRKEAREHIEKHYGYIKGRADLRQQPHGWRMPCASRVKIVTEPA